MKKLMIMMAVAACATFVGCGGDDTTPPDTTHCAVSFEVDLVAKADGTNNLATVLAGESVYLAGDFGLKTSTSTTPGGCAYGDSFWSSTATPAGYQAGGNNAFPCWRPDNAALVMTPNGDGTKYTATLSLLRGTALQYKATKTPDATCPEAGTSTPSGQALIDTCGWSNGPKHYLTSANFPVAGCPGSPSSTAGMFEWPSNASFNVPQAATAVAPVITVQAWRDYAHKTFGTVDCNTNG
jgi:hypothetical protein